MIEEHKSLAVELEELLNRHSVENSSNTPDFVLASFLMQTLKTWELHTVERDRWWGNRSLLGVGGGGDVSGRTIDGAVPTSEKSLLTGVSITGPRDLVGEALGKVSEGSGYQWGAPPLEPLDFPSGLVGAVNNLYSFHDKFGLPWITHEPTWPGVWRMRLRIELIEEEFRRELGQALTNLEVFLHQCGLGNGDHVFERDVPPGDRAYFRSLMSKVADGIVDSIYVLIGTGGEMGLDLAEVWRRVHAANMAKEGGGKRADGKVLKPEGWVAPDVEGAIFKSP